MLPSLQYLSNFETRVIAQQLPHAYNTHLNPAL
jgi:hypothetical protein